MYRNTMQHAKAYKTIFTHQDVTKYMNYNQIKWVKRLHLVIPRLYWQSIKTVTNFGNTHSIKPSHGEKTINLPSFQANFAPLVQSCAIWHSGTMSRPHGSLEHPGMTLSLQVVQNIIQMTLHGMLAPLLACWDSQTNPWHR